MVGLVETVWRAGLGCEVCDPRVAGSGSVLGNHRLLSRDFASSEADKGNMCTHV